MGKGGDGWGAIGRQNSWLKYGKCLSCIRLTTVSANRQRMNRSDIFILGWEGGIHKVPIVPAVSKGRSRTKGYMVLSTFLAARYAAAFSTVEGKFFPVLGEKYCLKNSPCFRTDIEKTTNHGIVMSYRLFGLHFICDIHVNNREYCESPITIKTVLKTDRVPT